MWGPLLAFQMRVWSETVLKPAQRLRHLGLYEAATMGTMPAPRERRGGGVALSRQTEPLTLLKTRPAHYERVRQFDESAADYQSAVAPYSGPIFEEVLALMTPYLAPDARLLDAASGPGREAILVAERVPKGEVIAVDLAEEMIKLAWHNAWEAGRTNMAFFQHDLCALPETWADYFDVVLCMLSFHYFADGDCVAKAFYEILAADGTAFVVDPTPSWFNMLGASLTTLAMPAFVRFRTGRQFHTLFLEAGFSSVYWTEILPGIGLTIASKRDV